MATTCYPSTTDWRCLPDGEQLDPFYKEDAERYAWTALRALTGFQTGNCPVTIRPCTKRCGAAGTWFVAPVSSSGYSGLYNGAGSFMPRVVDGVWVNSCGCAPTANCACSPMSMIRLPGPVAEITQVKIDGVVLASSEYKLIGSDLYRVTGEWPLCQNVAAADTEPDTFSVNYRQGFPIDNVINMAAGKLAMEFYYACTNDKRCQLPANAQLIVRQGVTVELAGSLFSSHYTGFPEVDVVIRSLNPHGLKVPARLWSPDRRQNA